MSCSCLQFNHFHVEHLLSEMERRNSNLHSSILKCSSLKFRKLTKRIQARIKFVLPHLSHSHPHIEPEKLQTKIHSLH